jgi:hypothetical protein
VFPFFELSSWIRIYSFGLTLTICFFLFLWMLHKLSKKFEYETWFFTKNIVWYLISIFIFSRLFYVIWKWNDLKYIRNPIDFFIMNDYNFSLYWALVWFFIVLLINLKLKKEEINKYIDGIVLSFIFVLFIGFVWALLWWQVYGRETHIGIEIMYNHPFTSVPFQVEIFPLPVIYSIAFFILFSALYIWSIFIKIRWFLWYIGLAAFASILLIFEFFSGKYDILKDSIFMNLPQLFSIILIAICAYKLYEILQANEKKSKISKRNVVKK